MPVGVELVDRATVKLAALPEKIRARLREHLIGDGKELTALIREKLSGDVLHIRTGSLLNSIKSELHENANAIYVRVYSAGVVYAGIHEYGGRTKPHMIYPRTARALHFFAKNGAEVFAKSVHHPGSKIPERSYLRSSLGEIRARLVADIQMAGKPEWA